MVSSSAAVFLGQALILVAMPYLIWRLPVVRLLLPLVVVQILMGIALGPSLLGRIFPASAGLLEQPALATLSGLAWLAVVLFAFLTGLHFDIAETAGRKRTFLLISLSSIAVPAGLGLVAGMTLSSLAPDLAGPAAGPVLFACAVAVATAVTALPVLGAILRETGLLAQRLGRDALGCAAINDLLLWILLAAVLSMAQAQAVDAGVLQRFGLGVIYLVTMFIIVKPVAARLLHNVARTDTCREVDLVIVISLALASAWITEYIGFHYILGSFIAGAILPPACARPLIRSIEPFTVIVLLPFFFMLTGLRTVITFDSDGFALVFAVSATAAFVGKMAGTIIPARLAGESWSYSVRLGTLMQCKGLMDVVVLSVLFEAGIISQAAFSGDGADGGRHHRRDQAAAAVEDRPERLLLCDRIEARTASLAQERA